MSDTHALEFKMVRKHYKGFDLQPTSFAVPRGCIMGLIGPNGAGKTTLIKLALDLVRCDGGSVRLLGLDHRASGRQVRARIGFVPDEPRLHEDVPLELLARATAPLYPSWDAERFAELVGAFELPMRKKLKTLSHGMKTKFALALALAHRPELLILDEPTAGLDPVFRRELLRMLLELMQDDQVSVLFSTHVTADLERAADYITFVKEGRLVFSLEKDTVLDSFRLVRGPREALANGESRDLFKGVREREHGFEALTSRSADVRRHFGDRVVLQPASLDDVMVLHAA